MLTERWNCFAAGFSGNTDTVRGIFAVIKDSYGAANRCYHTLEHVQHCLTELDRYTLAVTNRKAIEMALWLHDVIYVPEAGYNEELSSAAGFYYSLELSESHSFAAEVRRLIQATAHGSGKDSPAGDAAVVQDIDLSIFGAEANCFAKYENAIRQEYAHVSEEMYRKGRVRILQGFLASPQIFHTVFFRTRYEQQARRNLAGLISSLTGNC